MIVRPMAPRTDVRQTLPRRRVREPAPVSRRGPGAAVAEAAGRNGAGATRVATAPARRGGFRWLEEPGRQRRRSDRAAQTLNVGIALAGQWRGRRDGSARERKAGFRHASHAAADECPGHPCRDANRQHQALPFDVGHEPPRTLPRSRESPAAPDRVRSTRPGRREPQQNDRGGSPFARRQYAARFAAAGHALQGTTVSALERPAVAARATAVSASVQLEVVARATALSASRQLAAVAPAELAAPQPEAVEAAAPPCDWLSTRGARAPRDSQDRSTAPHRLPGAQADVAGFARGAGGSQMKLKRVPTAG